MKNVLAWLSVFSFSFFLLASVSTAAEGKPEYGNPVGTIVVADGLTGKEVQHAIMEAGAARDFTIKTRDDEKVVLWKEDGKWVINITFVYDTKEIQIFNKSARDGQMKTPDDIGKLKKDITKRLNTLAVTK